MDRVEDATTHMPLRWPRIAVAFALLSLVSLLALSWSGAGPAALQDGTVMQSAFQAPVLAFVMLALTCLLAAAAAVVA